MTGIIIKKDRSRPDIPLPNEEGVYDPDRAQDHTGVRFNARGKSKQGARGDARYDPEKLMQSPADFECVGCGAKDRFRIIAENHPLGEPLLQIRCAKCKHRMPVMRMGVVDMNDYIAKTTGLILPGQGTELIVDLEV